MVWETFDVWLNKKHAQSTAAYGTNGMFQKRYQKMSLKESTYRSGSSTARTVVSGYGVEKARVEIVFDTKSGYFWNEQIHAADDCAAQTKYI